MTRRLYDSKVTTGAYYVLFSVTVLTLLLLSAYVCIRLTIAIPTGYSIADGVMAALLLTAELFMWIHAVGYFTSVVKSGRRQMVAAPIVFARYATAPVAVLVATFNESEDVLEQTLASVRAMDYPATHLYVLDDSTDAARRDGARRLAAKYGAPFVHRTDRSGYKAGAINDVIPHLTEPYIALLDVDQRPLQHWLKEIVPYLEENPRLAFVQAPQVYVNTDGLPVAEAAKYQQAVFFEYICEGKSHSNAIFCCGSNVVIRRAALLSIERRVDWRRQFFDESSVTEDFATSLRLHMAGWRSDYVNEVYVVGMGPETLPAYFTQQMRWAMGTLAVGLQVLRSLLQRPRALTAGQWWEYLLSGTYYFVGIANLIFMAAPITFILFDVRPLRMRSDIYLAIFVPYIAFTMNLYFFGMKLRGYPMRGVWLASALSFATFWTYLKAALVAVLGLRRTFGVTPKGVATGAIPIRRLVPELLMLGANAAAAILGVCVLALGEDEMAYVINTLWASYHAILLSTLFFYFNRPVSIPPRRPLFEPVRLAA